MIFEDFECLKGDVDSLIEFHKNIAIKCIQENSHDGMITASENWKSLERYKNKINELLDEYDSIIAESTDECSYKNETEDIDDDFTGLRNFTFTDPIQIKLLGQIYEVNKSWREALIILCEELIKKQTNKFKDFDKNEVFKGRKRVYFSYNAKDLTSNTKKLSNGLYVELNLSANDIAKRCCDVVEQCGYNLDDIKFKVEWKEQSQEIKKIEKKLENKSEIKLPPKHSSVHIPRDLFEAIVNEIINYGNKNNVEFFNPRKISLDMNDLIISQSCYASTYHVVINLVNYLIDCKLVEKIEKGKYTVKNNRLIKDWFDKL